MSHSPGYGSVSCATQIQSFQYKLSKLKYSLAYAVSIQITFILATFLKWVKPNDFHMADEIINTISPLEAGGGEWKIIVLCPKTALRRQTQLSDSCEEASHPMWIFWNCRDIKVFSAMAPGNPWAGTCHIRPWKQSDGTSCEVHSFRIIE